MEPSAPGGIQMFLQQLAVVAMSAGLGGLASHARLVRMGQRRFWSLDLVWETPIAFALGMMANGAGLHYGLAPWANAGLISATAFFGPRFVEAVLSRYLRANVDK